MHVLISEPPAGLPATAAERLRHAGHVVHHCTDADAHAVCVALRGRSCPLDTHPVDVVIEIRSAPGVGGISDGVRCASRRGIPVIVASDEDVVDAAVTATETPSPRRSAVATDALHQALAVRGADSEDVSAVVTRRQGGMFVQVHVPPEVDNRVFGQAAVRIHQKLRLIDPWARSVDITRAGRASRAGRG